MGNIKSFCCRDNVSEIDDREERARILSDNNISANSIYNQSSNSGQDDLSYGSINTGAGKSVEQSALDKIYQKMAANVIDVAPGESMIIQPAEFIERQKAYQAKLNQIKTPLPLRSNNRVPKQHNNSSFDARINTSLASATPNLSSFNQNHANTSSTNHTFVSNNTTSGYTSNVTGSSTLTANSSNATNGNSPQHTTRSGPEKRRVEYEPISVDELQLINEISAKTVKALEELKVNSQEPVVARFQP